MRRRARYNDPLNRPLISPEEAVEDPRYSSDAYAINQKAIENLGGGPKAREKLGTFYDRTIVQNPNSWNFNPFSNKEVVEAAIRDYDRRFGGGGQKAMSDYFAALGGTPGGGGPGDDPVGPINPGPINPGDPLPYKPSPGVGGFRDEDVDLSDVKKFGGGALANIFSLLFGTNAADGIPFYEGGLLPNVFGSGSEEDPFHMLRQSLERRLSGATGYEKLPDGTYKPIGTVAGLTPAQLELYEARELGQDNLQKAIMGGVGGESMTLPGIHHRMGKTDTGNVDWWGYSERTPVYDADGNPVYDEDGNPVMLPGSPYLKGVQDSGAYGLIDDSMMSMDQLGAGSWAARNLSDRYARLGANIESANYRKMFEDIDEATAGELGQEFDAIAQQMQGAGLGRSGARTAAGARALNAAEKSRQARKEALIQDSAEQKARRMHETLITGMGIEDAAMGRELQKYLSDTGLTTQAALTLGDQQLAQQKFLEQLQRGGLDDLYREFSFQDALQQRSYDQEFQQAEMERQFQQQALDQMIAAGMIPMDILMQIGTGVAGGGAGSYRPNAPGISEQLLGSFGQQAIGSLLGGGGSGHGRDIMIDDILGT